MASNPCSCVAYVKSLTGFSDSIKYAKNWPRNSVEPRIGGVVITSESAAGTYTGHVAYIENIIGGVLILSEQNFKHFTKGDCPTTPRELPTTSPVILGYWNPNE